MSRAFVQLLEMVAGVLLGAASIGANVPAQARHEVLVLMSRDVEPYQKAAVAARDALRAQGWFVRAEVLNEQRTEAKGVGAVVAIGTEAARWSVQRLPTKAVMVYCMVSDSGAIDAPSGVRVEGISSEVPVPVQVELIRRALPSARKVGVLYAPASARSRRALDALREACGDLVVEAIAVSGKQEVGPAIEELLARSVDVVWTFPDSAVYDSGTIKAVLQATLRARVPVFGFSTPMVRAGALLGVGIDAGAQGVQAAAELVRLLNESEAAPRAADGPEYEVSVNLIVASHLRVQVPDEVVRRAAHVFKED